MEKIDKIIKEIEVSATKIPNNKLTINFKIYILLLLIFEY